MVGVALRLFVLREFSSASLSFAGPITLVANRAVLEIPGGDTDGGPHVVWAAPAIAEVPLVTELDAERDVSVLGTVLFAAKMERVPTGNAFLRVTVADL